MMLVYKAMYKYLDKTVFGQVLDFPGALTEGRNLKHAREMLASALLDMAEAHILRGEAIPLPDASKTNEESDIEEPIYLLMNSSTRVKIAPMSASA